MITIEFTKKGETWFAIIPHGKNLPISMNIHRENGTYNYVYILGDYYRIYEESTMERIANCQNFTLCFDNNSPDQLNDNAEKYITSSFFSRRRITVEISKGRCRICLSQLEPSKEGINCFHCNQGFTANSGICSGCITMGFRKEYCQGTRNRIMKIYRQKSHVYAHFPECMTSNLYKCHDCNRWIDNVKRKTALAHFDGFSASENVVRVGLCKTCEDKKEGMVYCGICKQTKSSMEKTKGGYICQSCLKTISKDYTSTSISYSPIRKNENERTFGIELEINHVAESKKLAEEVGKLDIGGVQFAVKEDGSVYYGMEIISAPASKELLFPAIKALFKVVRQYEHNYSRSGLHVHVGDTRNTGHKTAYAMLWLAMEKGILSLVQAERRTNDFCLPLNNRTINGASGETVARYINDVISSYNNYGRSARYRALNFCSLENHGTIEARCMESHTDYNRIRTFIEILDHMWTYCNKYSVGELDSKIPAIASMGFSDQLEEIGMHPMTIRYLVRVAYSLSYDDNTLSAPPERTKYTFKKLGKENTICPSYKGDITAGAISSLVDEDNDGRPLQRREQELFTINANAFNQHAASYLGDTIFDAASLRYSIRERTHGSN